MENGFEAFVEVFAGMFLEENSTYCKFTSFISSKFNKLKEK